MSYDIYLQMDTGGPKPRDLGYDWNYTSNCAPMWREAGADLAEFDGKLAGECEPILAAALVVLRAEPERFRAMNSPNGWGTYDRLLPKLEQLRAIFADNPKATVKVWR